MMIMERAADLPELEDSLKGRKVFIWTCNTCARLCNGMGGEDSAGRLAEELRGKGIDVVGIGSTSASCLKAKVAAKGCPEISSCDVILSLTCDIGSACARSVFSKDVINPFRTLGTGYLDEDGTPHLKDDSPITEMSEPYI